MEVDSEEKPSKSSSSRPPLLPPCRVCGDRASGFHYGANTCEGCKGFFRRALKNNGSFCCSSKNNCVLLPKKRNNCPSCRYKKCLEVGMSKTAIRTGRYTHAIRTKYILEVQGKTDTPESKNEDSDQGSATCDSTAGKSYSSHSDTLSPASVDSSAPPASVFSGGSYPADESVRTKQNLHESELEEIISVLMKAQEQIHEEDLDIFLDEEKIRSKQQKFAENGSKLPDSIAQMAGQLENGVSEQVPESLYTESKDTNQINKTTETSIPHDPMVEIGMYLNEGIKTMVKFAKAIPGFKSIPMEDQVILLKRSAVEFWLLGHFHCMNAELGVFVGELSMNKEEASLHWDKNYLDQLYELAGTLQKLKLSKEEVALLRAIVMTFRDRTGLKHRDMVESVQWKIIDCFRYLCKKTGDNFEKRFSFIMDKLTLTRDLTNSFENSCHSFNDNDGIGKKFPLLKEFFAS